MYTLVRECEWENKAGIRQVFSHVKACSEARSVLDRAGKATGEQGRLGHEYAVKHRVRYGDVDDPKRITRSEYSGVDFCINIKISCDFKPVITGRQLSPV